MKKIWILFAVLVTLGWSSPCDKKTFSLNAYDSISLMDIVKDLSRECEITVLFEDTRSKDRLSHSIDMINIKDYSLEQLFGFLFDEHNLFYHYDAVKNIVRVSYYDTKNIDIDYINMSELKTESVKSITVGAKSSSKDEGTKSITSGEGSNSDYTSVTATSTFTFWEKLKEHLSDILKIDEDYDSKINNILVDRDAAIVTITATKRQFQKVDEYLKKVESRMHSQVMIESYLIELTYENSKDRGVDWSNLSATLKPNFSYLSKSGANEAVDTTLNVSGLHSGLLTFGAEFSPTGLISFLDGYGDVEVLSNPKVLTLNNQPAVINVGKQLSYLYQDGSVEIGDGASPTYELGSVFVGLTLNIIPEITEDNHIIMRVNPVTSELLNEDTSTSSSTSSDFRTMPPDTRIKQMSSIVKVKDKQRVVIGGLIEKREDNENSKVPVLGDIPLLGKLFSHEGKSIQKTELFILIIPTLIKNSNFPTLDEAISKRIK